jgi:hypothetical protein
MRTVRFCTLLPSLLIILASAWSQPATVDDAARRRQAELQSQANQLIQQGQFQKAVQVLEGLSGNRQDIGPLLQLLDLQVRLKDEEGAGRSLDSLARRLPADGVPRNWADFQVAGAMAGARYRLGQPARAAELWKKLREQARSEELALAVFQSYRQVQLLDEALAWAGEQRRQRGRDDLWAFELAQVHEEAGRPREAFDELARWQCRQAGGAQVSERLLTLAEGALDRADLLRYMLRRLDGRRDTCPALGQAVLGVLVQQNWIREAVELAWRLDEDRSGQLPYELAADLARDGHAAESLALLEELRRQGRPQAAGPDFILLQAGNLARLDRPQEALALYRQVAAQGSNKANQARLKAAELLHRPLQRLPEAVEELETLLSRQTANRPAGTLLVQLLACQGDTARARQVLRTMANWPRAAGEQRAELAWLDIRLSWWAGELTACRTGLGAFLKTSTRQEECNDAIELMDLLGFAATDSLTVAEAARADRLAFAGRWREALELLHGLAEGAKSKLAEWLDWQACLLAEKELAPGELRAEYDRYRRRQPRSLRLDRLAWMEMLAAEREGLPTDSLRAQALALLETWPHSLLQDTVRRRLRQWEPVAAPAHAESEEARPAVEEGPPR